jgi:tRNA-binding EMAP/Myf-like protein
VVEKVAKVEKAEKVEHSVLAPVRVRIGDEEIAQTHLAMQEKLDTTRQKVRKDYKGLLSSDFCGDP